jgi:hypothetical protein
VGALDNSWSTHCRSGDSKDACGTLGAFINQVKAQSGKSIPAGTASSLIAAAQQIEAVIGCKP